MLRRGAAEYRTAAEIKPVEPETDNAGAGIGKCHGAKAPPQRRQSA